MLTDIAECHVLCVPGIEQMVKAGALDALTMATIQSSAKYIVAAKRKKIIIVACVRISHAPNWVKWEISGILIQIM